jgi:hypothetical protein
MKSNGLLRFLTISSVHLRGTACPGLLNTERRRRLPGRRDGRSSNVVNFFSSNAERGETGSPPGMDRGETTIAGTMAVNSAKLDPAAHLGLRTHSSTPRTIRKVSQFALDWPSRTSALRAICPDRSSFDHRRAFFTVAIVTVPLFSVPVLASPSPLPDRHPTTDRVPDRHCLDRGRLIAAILTVSVPSADADECPRPENQT